MFKTKRWIMAGLLAATMAAGVCSAEEPGEAPKLFKFEFVVKEVSGGKVLNSRSYTTMVSAGDSKSEIRAGSKIPYASSSGGSGTVWQQLDVGVNIDVLRVKELQDKLACFIVMEVSSVVEPVRDQLHPTVRQNRWTSGVVIPLKKPTTLFSSENVDAKTQIQVEVTASPVL